MVSNKLKTTTYNPYALIDLLINGKSATGRPIAFDSDVVDQRSMTNGFGKLVKPSKAVSTCPDCGHAIEIDLNFTDPPFPVIIYDCQRCRPPQVKPALVDPFVNPVASGRIKPAELDPLAIDPTVNKSQAVQAMASIAKVTIPDIPKQPENLILPQPDFQMVVQPTPERQSLEPPDDLEEETEFDDTDIIEDDE